MASQFVDGRGQAGQYVGRNRVQVTVPAVVRDRRIAPESVKIPGRPYEDGLFLRVRLGQGRDRAAVVVAQVLLGEAVDTGREAQGQRQDVHLPLAVPPGKDPLIPRGMPRVRGGQDLERFERSAARPARRNGEHGDVGTPGHAVRGVFITGPCARGDARYRGTVGGGLLPGLVDRAVQECLRDLLAGERRMVQVDAGVHDTDGHPGTRLGVRTLEHAQVGVGLVRLDVRQLPLVLNARIIPEFPGHRSHGLVEFLRLDTEVLDGNAFLRSGTADGATAGEGEHQEDDDGISVR